MRRLLLNSCTFVDAITLAAVVIPELAAYESQLNQTVVTHVSIFDTRWLSRYQWPSQTVFGSRSEQEKRPRNLDDWPPATFFTM